MKGVLLPSVKRGGCLIDLCTHINSILVSPECSFEKTRKAEKRKIGTKEILLSTFVRFTM